MATPSSPSRFALVVAAAFLAGCGSGPGPARGSSPPADGAPADGAPAPRSAGGPAAVTVSAESVRAPARERPAVEVIELEVPKYEPALVLTPATTAPAPVIIVAHGAGGRPEPHCARYAELVRGRGFVVCTRGRPMGKHLPEKERGYFYDGHFELGHEVAAVLGALGRRFGARVDREGAIYAGYSQGATMGILYLQQGGAAEARVGKVLLVEGGSGEWTVGLAAKLKKEGVAKVAIVCGQVSCRRASNKSEGWIRQGGLEVRTAYAQGAGHVYGGAVATEVDALWPWLVEGDPRWSVASAPTP